METECWIMLRNWLEVEERSEIDRRIDQNIAGELLFFDIFPFKNTFIPDFMYYMVPDYTLFLYYSILLPVSA